MATASARSVVRAILSADPNMAADEVIRRARARGLRVPEASIRRTVHNVRSDLKRAPKSAPAAARSAARATTNSGPAPGSASAPASVPATPPAAPDPAPVLANVALVNAAVGACGGVDQARQVAEAVRACGGVDGFLLHLDLVAGIRAST